MKRYNIRLTRHGRQWCEIVIESLDPEDVLADVIGRYPPAEGFKLSVWEETEVARVVEVGSDARVLGVSYQRKPVDTARAAQTGER